MKHWKRSSARCAYLIDGDFMKLSRPVAMGAVLGLLIPITLELLWHFDADVAESWWIALWPSSIQLMVLHRNSSTLLVAWVLSFSIGVNMILYAIAASVLAFLCFHPRRLVHTLFART